MCGDLQKFFGKGMVLGLAVLLAVLLVFVGGSEGGSASNKFVRDLRLVCALVLRDGLSTIRKPKSQDLGRGSTSSLAATSSSWWNNPMMVDGGRVGRYKEVW